METEPVRILLAEGEQGDLSKVRDLLSGAKLGHFVLQIAKGADLVRRELLEGHYDICLLDEQISEQRGIDLIHRTLLIKPDAPVVLVAKSEDHDLDLAAMRAGAADFLIVNQINQNSLERTIRHAIEHKRIEASLHMTRQRADQLAAIVEGADYAIIGKTLDGIISSWNSAAQLLYGYTADEMIGQPITRILPPDRLSEVNELIAKISSGEKVRTFETVRVDKRGEVLDVSLSISPMRDSSGRIIGASIIASDIRQRKLAEAQIEKQLRRIQALRTIDLAITGSLDLRVTLNVLLDQVTTHLKVDAASVLLLNPHSRHLEYAAGRGYRTNNLARTDLRLGEGAAGKAALNRKTISIPDLRQDNIDFSRSRLIAGEQFVTYWAVPLITKGRVEGVLEVFNRTPMTGEGDWMDFLETLAGQAAIAIENADLFADLQRSNNELHIAYDSTLEGWSKALDLRDRETEGHTLRVTEATLQLARSKGIPEIELVQIRRGALLHDIGKMGIPDSILLKAGSLTVDEWNIMKQHPVYAYELLSPIPFLREALDIPYCHHEKWDGSGYPRGLKGSQIPLAARLFCVVDVWDALRSDRPYRSAWTEEAVREHIASGAGTHFEPDIIELFLSSNP